MREVAIESGWSTGVLNHYFENKQQLLFGGLRLAAKEVGVRIDRAMKGKTGPDRLRAVIEAGMPIDEHRGALCRIFYFFWAEGISDPELAAQLEKYYDWWRARVCETVEIGQQEGWVKAGDAQILAEMCIAVADGIGIQAMFSKKSMSKKRQRDHVKLILSLISAGKQ